MVDMSTTTCSSDTIVSIYRGNCIEPSCIGFVEHPFCAFESIGTIQESTWLAESGVTYYILVRSRAESVTLSIRQFIGQGYFRENADGPHLANRGALRPIFAPSYSLPRISPILPFEESYMDYWLTFLGTGSEMMATTCIEGEVQIGTSLSVSTASDRNASATADHKVGRVDNGAACASATWNSTMERLYYIAVHLDFQASSLTEDGLLTFALNVTSE